MYSHEGKKNLPTKAPPSSDHGQNDALALGWSGMRLAPHPFKSSVLVPQHFSKAHPNDAKRRQSKLSLGSVFFIFHA